MDMEKFAEIEDLVCWNLSYGISVVDTLTEINQLQLLKYFRV
jgi:hypothetical protein